MSKFNANIKNTNATTTFEGGKAFVKNIEDEWMNALFSSFMQDTYYEESDVQQNRYAELTRGMINKYGADFVTKAAIFSRNRLGMRSIANYTMAIANYYKFDGKRDAFARYFHRPDDVAEVFAAIDSLGEKRSHALVRGAADYLSGVNEYGIAKYAMQGKQYNMFDLINITHAHSRAIDKFKNDMLAAPDTWEHNVMLAEDKNDAWKELVEKDKLGYMALIRNLRNILACDFVDDDWIEEYLVPKIVDENRIKSSLIFPYRLYTAYKQLYNASPIVIAALSKAFKFSVKNVPNLDGNNAIILDVSGSMGSRWGKSNMTIKEICAVYAAMVYVANFHTTFIKFGSSAKTLSFNRNDNIFKIIERMASNESCGYGTELLSALNLIADKNYDRVFVFSDMQTMDNSYDRDLAFYRGVSNETILGFVKRRPDTMFYSFDLGNYHSSPVKSGMKNVTFLTALNDNLFIILDFLEHGGKSLVQFIQKNY